MQIRNPCVVSLTWKLADAQNRPLDELAEAVEFFYGGDDLLAKVEEALAGHESGDDLQLQLEPADAFGDYRPELVCFEQEENNGGNLTSLAMDGKCFLKINK